MAPVATVLDTEHLRATDREPRLALSLTLERTVAGLPSAAELASLVGVVTIVFELADPDGALRPAMSSPLTVERAHTGAITALAVLQHDGAALIISAGRDDALRICSARGEQIRERNDNGEGSQVPGLREEHASAVHHQPVEVLRLPDHRQEGSGLLKPAIGTEDHQNVESADV
jgi:hypothetical protein